MAKKAAQTARSESGLYLAIENQDWVAIRGTPSALARLGRLLIQFAEAEGPDFANLDSPSSLFRPGSLGLTLYRNAEPIYGLECQ